MATPERPALTLSQAAKATGKHRNTVRNSLVADRFPNAYRDGAGTWRIPVADLLAVGWTLYAPTPADDESGAATASTSTSTPATDDELERLRAEVQDLRRRMELAEAIAAERERIVERLLAAIPALPPAGRTRRWPWSRNPNT